jgi:two-component system, response regulator PdtaR
MDPAACGGADSTLRHLGAVCHVLIIEDDWLIADHIAQLVQSAGALSIDMAETEDEAVAHAMARRPAVIISELRLRAGSGPAAVDRIVRALGSIAVLFVTGEPKALQPHLPDTLVFDKPVEDHVLVTTFRQIAHLAPS